MCMLIHHPADAEPFTREEFEDFHHRSPHGFGAMWRTALGELHSRKGLMEVGQSWQIYRSLIANGCHEMVLHWRYRTAGPTNVENCHPFVVPNTGLLLMHNGPRIGPSTETKSDSAVFAESLGREIAKLGHHATIDEPRWLETLRQRIGSDKLALWHRNDPKPLLVGEAGGLWYRGRWMSNTYAWTMPNEARPKRETTFDAFPSYSEWKRRPKFDWQRHYG